VYFEGYSEVWVSQNADFPCNDSFHGVDLVLLLIRPFPCFFGLAKAEVVAVERYVPGLCVLWSFSTLFPNAGWGTIKIPGPSDFGRVWN
jgi:hypothetical protein